MERILVNQRFVDFEVFKEAARKWHLDFIQIEKGQFQGEIFQYEAPDMIFSRTHSTLSTTTKMSRSQSWVTSNFSWPT